MPKGDRPARPLRADEVRGLLAALPGDTLAQVRDHALLVVMWRCGLRCAEALDLRPEDVDFDAGTVRVEHGKGRRARVVGADDAALAVLSVWLDRRQAAGVTDGLLFCRLRGQPGAKLSTRYVRAMMARTAKRAGAVRRAHPHQLRHTHAVELHREGWSVMEISRDLGHSNVAVTDIYLNHLFPAEIVAKARARTWAS